MHLPFKAIAAMALNRVIGCQNRIPWHLPEDFRWFKQVTTGNVVVMGRKTFESIGKPLPNRHTIVLTRSVFEIPGVRIIPSLEALQMALPEFTGKQVFICGGAQIYEQALPQCSELYLTLVLKEVPGDTFFPPFEHLFNAPEVISECADFRICRYERKARTGQLG